MKQTLTADVLLDGILQLFRGFAVGFEAIVMKHLDGCTDGMEVRDLV